MCRCYLRVQIVNDDIDRAYEELKSIIKSDIEAAQKAIGGI
jgi:hypothetical protein